MKKNFDVAAILSLTTRRLLCDFADMQELAEFIVNHPIWTHEFADKFLYNHLRDTIFKQYPELEMVDASNVNTDNYKEFVIKQYDKFGKTLEITQCSEIRHRSPEETAKELMPNKKIINVEI